MSRIATAPIAPLFVERWSPRAMSGAVISQAEIRRLLEAARWAPSASNVQPWRFVYGLAGTPFFDALLGVLVESNRVWCARAGALLVIAARTHADNGKPAPSHAFDTGAAWMSLALQGSIDQLVVHGMLGFDQAAARTVAAIPESMVIQCMVAVGQPGKVEDLSPNLQAREQPSNRRLVEEWAVEGPWTGERT